MPFAAEHQMSELADDPQVRHLDLFYELDHPTAGTVKSVHRAIRLDGSRDIDFRPPPMLGEHTYEVLSALGIAGDKLEALAAGGIVQQAA